MNTPTITVDKKIAQDLIKLYKVYEKSEYYNHHTDFRSFISWLETQVSIY